MNTIFNLHFGIAFLSLVFAWDVAIKTARTGDTLRAILYGMAGIILVVAIVLTIAGNHQ